MNIMERAIGLVVFILFLPFFAVLYICFYIKGNTFIFRQKRMGKGKKVFLIYKIRTMNKNAEEMKKYFAYLNEADGPIFKIKNDPRYIKVGKILAHLGLDESLQLINIIKGDMSFVGPRPLPIDEAKQIPKKYQDRFSVLPGITSLWVVSGGHSLSFKKWMELDLYYVTNRSFWLDIRIVLRTIGLFLKVSVQYLAKPWLKLS